MATKLPKLPTFLARKEKPTNNKANTADAQDSTKEPRGYILCQADKDKTGGQTIKDKKTNDAESHSATARNTKQASSSPTYTDMTTSPTQGAQANKHPKSQRQTQSSLPDSAITKQTHAAKGTMQTHAAKGTMQTHVAKGFSTPDVDQVYLCIAEGATTAATVGSMAINKGRTSLTGPPCQENKSRRTYGQPQAGTDSVVLGSRLEGQTQIDDTQTRVEERQQEAYRVVNLRPKIHLNLFILVCILLLICFVITILTLCGVFDSHPQMDAQRQLAYGGGKVTEGTFGITRDGQTVFNYTLVNSNNVKLQVMSLGAAVVSISVPDKRGKIDDVVLGFDSLGGYDTIDRSANPYFGAIIGRYCGRIREATLRVFNPFTEKWELSQVSVNEGNNSKDGGKKGFDKYVWNSKTEGDSVMFSLTSPHNDQGYPGKVNIHVRYDLTDENEVIIDINATSDRQTPINVCSNLFFNLAGARSMQTIDKKHQFEINAYRMVEDGSQYLATGRLQNISKAYSFLRPRKLSSVEMRGVEETYCILGAPGMRRAASAFDKTTGRYMEVYSDQPGLGFNTGHKLNTRGKGNTAYRKFSGFCMRPQNYPDSFAYVAKFPDSVLRPGSTYRYRTVYKFSTKF